MLLSLMLIRSCPGKPVKQAKLASRAAARIMVAAMARIPTNIRNLWRPPVKLLPPVTFIANYVPAFLPLMINGADKAPAINDVLFRTKAQKMEDRHIWNWLNRPAFPAQMRDSSFGARRRVTSRLFQHSASMRAPFIARVIFVSASLLKSMSLGKCSSDSYITRQAYLNLLRSCCQKTNSVIATITNPIRILESIRFSFRTLS